MPSATVSGKMSKKQDFGHYALLIGLMLQLFAILWFAFIWFTFRTNIVEYQNTKTELLFPIYLLYGLGIIISIIGQLIGLKQVRPENRQARLFLIFAHPIASIFLLICLIDAIKFGFT